VFLTLQTGRKLKAFRTETKMQSVSKAPSLCLQKMRYLSDNFVV